MKEVDLRVAASDSSSFNFSEEDIRLAESVSGGKVRLTVLVPQALMPWLTDIAGRYGFGVEHAVPLILINVYRNKPLWTKTVEARGSGSVGGGSSGGSDEDEVLAGRVVSCPICVGQVDKLGVEGVAAWPVRSFIPSTFLDHLLSVHPSFLLDELNKRASEEGGKEDRGA
ncbi:MAG: hypothetical protein QW688_08315 [Thermoprotei archaeon]